MLPRYVDRQKNRPVGITRVTINFVSMPGCRWMRPGMLHAAEAAIQDPSIPREATKEG